MARHRSIRRLSNFAVVAATFLAACGNPLCDLTDITEVAVSDEWSVVAHAVRCGATTSDEVVGRLVKRGRRIDGGLPLFRAEHAVAVELRRLAADTIGVYVWGSLTEKEERVGGTVLVYMKDDDWIDSVYRARWPRLDDRSIHVDRQVR